MAGKDDRYTERLREKSRRFDERGRKGTLVQEQVAALDAQEREKAKLPAAAPKKKEDIEEEKNNDHTV